MKRVQMGFALSVAATLAAPAMAFAEEEGSSSGAELLIPKPAEFLPALVIFLVILVLLGKFVWPVVLKTLDAREQQIKDDLDEAAELKDQAAETRDEADALVVDARRQASEIVLEARRDAEAARAKILADAREEADQIVSDARERAVKEQRLMYDHATDSIAKMSVAVASRIVDEQLSVDEDLQRKVIKKYLAEVGNLNG